MRCSKGTYELLYIPSFEAVYGVVAAEDKSCVKNVTFYIKCDEFGTSHGCRIC
jgi:hypothetical protein